MVVYPEVRYSAYQRVDVAGIVEAADTGTVAVRICRQRSAERGGCYQCPITVYLYRRTLPSEGEVVPLIIRTINSPRTGSKLENYLSG